MTVTIEGLAKWQVDAMIPERPLLVGWAGSKAAHTSLPPEAKFATDDLDITAVVVSPLRYYIGLSPGPVLPSRHRMNEWDVTSIDVRTFIRNAYKGDPGALSILWLNPKDYLFTSPIGRMLIDNRNMFMTKRVLEQYGAVAMASLAKIHEAPKGDIWKMSEKQKMFDLFGFNTHAAAKCLRFLQMGAEIASEGGLWIDRETQKKDANLFMNVVSGKWPIAQTLGCIEAMHEVFKNAVLRTALPLTPKFLDIQDFTMDILALALQGEITSRALGASYREERRFLATQGIDPDDPGGDKSDQAPLVEAQAPLGP